MRNSEFPPAGNRVPRDLTAVLVYPNTKGVALASLGFLKVFGMLAGRLRAADLAYLPEGPHDPVLSPKQGFLLGYLSRNRIRDFDIVGFSVSYENDFVRIPELLIAAGVPPLAEARGDLLPLVVCGGFTMSINPLPIADFVDAVVVGEAEPVVEPLLQAIEDAKVKGLGKPALLEALSQLEGVWVPSLGHRGVKRVWSKVEDIAPEPRIEVSSHFGEMFLVEVGRGCGKGCLFCAAGNLYRPVRVRDEVAVLRHAGGAKKIGLVGTAVGDHPALVGILEKLAREGREVGLASLRADEITPEVARLIVKCGARTITIAPEAGSETLRASIGKHITQEEIRDAVKTLAGAGITTIKLYFMIGLPGETDQDMEAIVALVSDLAEMRGRSKLRVAVAPFVPKPHTAFQWCAFAERETLARRVHILRRIASIRGCSLKIGSLEEAWVEAMLSRGGRNLSRALLEVAEKKIPLRALLRHRPPIDVHADLDVEKPLPWDFIDSGVARAGLKEAFRRSKET